MVTEVTDESWFSRLSGAFKGILFGGLLIIAVPIGLFWNEGRAVKTAKGLQEGARVAQDVEVIAINSANEGKLVHAEGMAETDEVLRDPIFGIEYNGVRLKRHVESYQWKEDESTNTKKKLGGGTRKTTEYTYKKVWKSDIQNSSKFKEQSGHENPADMQFSATKIEAKDVRLGEFRLPGSLVSAIYKPEPIQFTPDQLPDDLRGQLTLGDREGSTLAYWKNHQSSGVSSAIENGDSIPSSPQIGDTRIWFTATPVSEISLLSAQHGESFEPYQTQQGTKLHRLEMGSVSAASMIQHAETENMILTWVIRGVGLFVIFLGFVMLMRPLVVFADVVPLFGSLVGFGTGLIAFLLAATVSLTTIGIAWVVYRPLLGVTLIAIAGGCLFMIYRRGRVAAAA